MTAALNLVHLSFSPDTDTPENDEEDIKGTNIISFIHLHCPTAAVVLYLVIAIDSLSEAAFAVQFAARQRIYQHRDTHHTVQTSQPGASLQQLSTVTHSFVSGDMSYSEWAAAFLPSNMDSTEEVINKFERAILGSDFINNNDSVLLTGEDMDTLQLSNSWVRNTGGFMTPYL
ncbi:hypothetical protein SEUCBS139899_000696 [Sporothrix eucalyptigena]